ncbi:MAG: 50S ribosomal protein L15 [Dehalococcoidia bacterium]|nr:50S ribosomal protein L15 [Dehalococcoidia bacterium]
MRQNDIAPGSGAKHSRKRVGRGNASGHGTYSGRGLKGQKSRSGGGVRVGFEGGQLPLIKRLPYKRGFTNIFKVEYNIINVSQLNVFPSGAEVTAKTLLEKGLLKSLRKPIKILGKGKLDRALRIRVNKLSVSARDKVEKAGGEIMEVSGAQKAAK